MSTSLHQRGCRCGSPPHSVAPYAPHEAQMGMKFKGSIAAATFNLSNVAIGGGLLSFPFVIKETGVVLGFVLGCFLSLLMAASAEMVASVSAQVWEAKQTENEGDERRMTYEKIVEKEFGPTAGVIVALCIVVNVFAAQIAPFIIIGDMTESLLDNWVSDNLRGSWWASRAFVTAVLGVTVMLPLSCTRRIDHLRFTSLLSIISIAFTASVVVWNSLTFRTSDTFQDPTLDIMEERGDIQLAVWDWGVFSAIPIISYSLSCHIQVPSIFADMRRPTVGKFRLVIALTFSICLAAYNVAGEFGYLQFGDSTEGNILLNYPADDVLANCARVAMTVTMMFSYPLMSYINRVALDFAAISLMEHCGDGVAPPPRDLQESSWDIGDVGDEKGTVDDDVSRLRMSLPSVGASYWVRVVLVSLGLMAIAWTVSVAVPEVQLVFGLTGALITTVTTFLIPPLVFWRFNRHNVLIGWVLPALVAVIGTLIGFLGTWSTLADIVNSF